MAFASALSTDSKLERALVVAFALAEALVHGGERVGIPGLLRPTASRNVIEKIAEAILHDLTERASLPPSFAPSPLSETVGLADLWAPITDTEQPIAQLSGPVVVLAAGPATPAAHRFSADTPSVRNCAEGGNAGAYTVVAHSAAAGIGGTRHRGCGRTAMESSSRDRE